MGRAGGPYHSYRDPATALHLDGGPNMALDLDGDPDMALGFDCSPATALDLYRYEYGS